ncbi:hypothetical protein BD324DRAFT_619851 [Kockovaella imperatae]|uniref:Uncharacterized protein n=1 Tax=Kockovaella imperatae TaxID=4999 RepID=A0A1Y1UJE0_9TREE|nr:hypothetical protein BD324DRAFT_619851 [Kockovaella imperatae]ORX38173.1 hypothetical protein BD324DRAFT_619851 [Kockovaella imperatae]
MPLSSAGPVSEAFYSIATQALCVAAVVKGCRYSLRVSPSYALSLTPQRWIVVETLRPSPVQPDTFTTTVKNKCLFISVLAVAFLVPLAIWFGLMFGLRQIKSELWLNIAFGAILWIASTAANYHGSIVLFTPARTAQLAYSELIPGVYELREKTQGSSLVRLAGAAALSAACIYLSSKGVRILQPVLTTSVVLTLAGLNSANHRISVRGANMFMALYMFGVPILAVTMWGAHEILARIFHWKEETPRPDGSPDLYDWMLRLFLAFVIAMPSALASVFIGMALRFEYSSSGTGLHRSQPGEEVLIPADPPYFSRPMFNASVLVLGIVVLMGEVGVCLVDPTHLQDVLWLIPAVPITVIVQLLLARRWGVWRDWWTYAEIWVPRKEDLLKRAYNIAAEEEDGGHYHS